MKTSKLLIGTVAVVAAFAAAKAKAQNLTATLNTIDPALGVTGTLDNGSFIQAYPSGVMDFTNFQAFCVEPLQDIAYGETLVYQIQNSSSLVNSDTISRLIGGYLSSSQNNQQAAAVQWAIWEVTNETTKAPSLTDGNVRITGSGDQSIALLANQYLANVGSYAPANITFLHSDTHQDVVTWNVVPEPASAGLAALSGLFLLRRRRR